jgi:hypothetical protein
MKKLLTFALGLGLVFTVASTASAAATTIAPSDYGTNAVANGIVNSRHNLGSTGVHFNAGNFNATLNGGGTSEVCVFCHTPHHGGSDVPLWNKGAGDSASYTTYGSTIAGTSISTVGASSLACLSCHDGVNTFDTIVNFPGKDGTAATDLGWTFSEDGNKMADFMTHSGRLNIGTDLTNDHPISVSYTETTKASLRTTATVISTVTMHNNVLTTGNDGDTASAIYAENRWSVGGYIKDGATINELLRDSKVECASCHDPHFSNKSWDEVAVTWDTATVDPLTGQDDMDGLFLRRVGGNSLSGVCRTCHNK